jgi:hypothetical protein
VIKDLAYSDTGAPDKMVLTRIALGKKRLPPGCAAVPHVSTRICHIMEHDGDSVEAISDSAN